MGDHLRVGISPRYVTKPTKPTQPCIPPMSLYQVPALIGRGENVTSAGWQVILCDPRGHENSRNGEACLQTAYMDLPLLNSYLHGQQNFTSAIS